MTTHEATALQPSTPIHHNYLKHPNEATITGKASPDLHQTIRVVWDDLAEPDSLLFLTDRLSLAAIAIDHPAAEPGF